MDPTRVYALVSLAFAIVWLGVSVLYKQVQLFRHLAEPFWRKNIAWAPVPQITLLNFLIVLGFGVTNILCVTVTVSDLSSLVLRERMTLLSRYFGVRLDTSKLFHRVLGVITVIKVAVHVGITAYLHKVNFQVRTDAGAVSVRYPSCLHGVHS